MDLKAWNTIPLQDLSSEQIYEGLLEALKGITALLPSEAKELVIASFDRPFEDGGAVWINGRGEVTYDGKFLYEDDVKLDADEALLEAVGRLEVLEFGKGTVSLNEDKTYAVEDIHNMLFWGTDPQGFILGLFGYTGKALQDEILEELEEVKEWNHWNVASRFQTLSLRLMLLFLLGNEGVLLPGQVAEGGMSFRRGQESRPAEEYTSRLDVVVSALHKGIYVECNVFDKKVSPVPFRNQVADDETLADVSRSDILKAYNEARKGYKSFESGKVEMEILDETKNFRVKGKISHVFPAR